MTEHEPVRKSSLSRRRILERALHGACATLLLIMLMVAAAAAVLWTQDLTAQVSNGASLAPAAKSAPQTPTPGTVTKEGTPANPTDTESAIEKARKDLETQIAGARQDSMARIDEKAEGAKAILDALIALVGIYSFIVGLTAFVSVKFAREDAKEQIETLRGDAREQFKTLRDEADKQIQALQAKIQKIEDTFPEFGDLDVRLQRLFREVELRLPPEADWNDKESFRTLTEKDKQKILDEEMAISATISVFALDRSPILRARLVSIYAAFARFYSARSKVSPVSSESDYERARSYATRAIELKPEPVSEYRLRGAIHLARYERGLMAKPPEDEGTLKPFLDLAEEDLKYAASSRDTVDAGAFYDLALVKHYENDRMGAVTRSRELIAKKDKISPMHRVKYLPGTYRNLGCYLAMLADQAGPSEPEKMRQWSIASVEALKDGLVEFRRTMDQDRGLNELEKGISQELEPGGDFARLEPNYKEQIAELIKPHTPASQATATQPPATQAP